MPKNKHERQSHSVNLEAQTSWHEDSGHRQVPAPLPAVQQRAFYSKHITYLCLTDTYC